MKTIVYGYQPKESMIDYEGCLSQVLFTSGCNLRCGFCHNAALTTKKEGTLTKEKLDEILAKARDNWIGGVVISGGEPTLHEELPELIEYLRGKGFLVKLDTNGTKPEMLERVVDELNYIAMDYKTCMARYKAVVNAAVNPNVIRRSVELLKQRAIDYELRTTIVPGVHTEDVIRQICSEIKGVKRYIIQPFVPQEKLMDEEYAKKDRTKPQVMEQYLKICKDILGPMADIRIRS
jgi:pyruvate formate lyase activating enzyme